jgi:hypothetical protein
MDLPFFRCFTVNLVKKDKLLSNLLKIGKIILNLLDLGKLTLKSKFVFVFTLKVTGSRQLTFTRPKLTSIQKYRKPKYTKH